LSKAGHAQEELRQQMMHVQLFVGMDSSLEQMYVMTLIQKTKMDVTQPALLKLAGSAIQSRALATK